MKLAALILSLIPFSYGSLFAQQSDFPKLTGLYFGQKPPGTTPEIFAPGIVSTSNDREFSGTFSPDGKEYYFFRFADSAGMMVSKLVGDRWSAPRPASFNSKYVDNEPHITRDGKYMFFCSNRPFPGSADQKIMTQVWIMEREGDSWGAPKHLCMGMMPTTSDKGNVFIGSKIFKLADDRLVEVGELDFDSTVPMNERLPRHHTCIAPDESYHIFDFEQNLYISFRKKNGLWGRPIDLSQRLNLPEGEMLATLSPDNKYLFFCNRGDIYWVSAKIIDELISMAGASLPQSSEAPERRAPKLSEKLSVLKPFIGPTWVGSIPNDSRMGEITLKWEVLLNGFAVRLGRNILNSGHWLETTYYWDESAGKVAYLAISNNGFVSKGYIAGQGEELISEGDQQGPDSHRKVKRIYKLDKEGKLYEDDQFRSSEAEEWRRTHISVFISK